MAPIRDPVLTVWQALKLLNNVHVQSEVPEIFEVHAEAERALFNLVLVLARWEKTRLISSEARVIPLIADSREYREGPCPCRSRSSLR
jgi:hypothetical protein